MRSEGRRRRVRHAHSAPNLDTSRVLSASEIGEYAYCPQAWYYRRAGIQVSRTARLRRQEGNRVHRQIGRHTDSMRATDVARSAALTCCFLLLLLLVVWELGFRP